MNYVMVALGGALGALSRYAVYNLGAFFSITSFYATLTVNVVGAWAIGVLYVLFVEQGSGQSIKQQLLTVGFLGAFTTYSTYSLDAWRLLAGGQVLTALCYLMGTMLLCLLATWLGVDVARTFS